MIEGLLIGGVALFAIGFAFLITYCILEDLKNKRKKKK